MSDVRTREEICGRYILLCRAALASLGIAIFSLIGVFIGVYSRVYYPTLLCCFTFIVTLVSFVCLCYIITHIEEEHPEVLDLYPPYD
jgi:hypothetical protein